MSISPEDAVRLKKVDKKRRSYLAHKKWAVKNHEQKLASTKRWRKRHPEKMREYHVKSRYKRYVLLGSHTKRQWESLKKRHNYCCAICGMQEPFIGQYITFLTEDHIVPICVGGTNHISNIQPLCFMCNCVKGGKVKA